MTDNELLMLLQSIHDRSKQQMEDLLKLKEAGVAVQSDDGATLGDMIQRELNATQSIQGTMASVRNRVS